ncbi:MAG: SDR family oxidoreductase [Firmicutes bacterium]|nr:SDR family oxidoreductase [Bacillota bacterium]
MDYGLQGKTVLVTASSKGLGRATAQLFAAEGARVMLSSRSEAALRQTAQEIKAATGNPQVSYCQADVGRVQDIEQLFSATEREFGGVDVLINNAGGPHTGHFDAITDEQWAQAFSTTLMSMVRATRRALVHMRHQQWGRIVNFASSSIKQPLDQLVLSNTYRAGILGLAKSLATELAEYGILVNTLGPGRIDTDRVRSLDADRAARMGVSVAEVQKQAMSLIPLGRYGTPEEFAALAVFLGSPMNGYITGQAILVDGGLVKSL